MKFLKKLFKTLGPGFITGASDDDPSGIATYSQTGAQFGLLQSWTALFSFPLQTAVQEMCGRIGLVTGKGLAGVIRQHYPKKLLYGVVMLLLIANIVNIGADLGAMAASVQLLIDISFALVLIMITLFIVLLQVFVSYKHYSRILKFLTFSLFAYIATALVVNVQWLDVLKALIIPHVEFNKEYILNLVAIFGTTISPYLFFWQTSEEVEEEVEHGRLRQMGAGVPHVYKKDITNLQIDTTIGMFFSNLIMLFIIVTAGATLFPNGILQIESAHEAALALKPLAGDFAFVLFALGIVGTGLLAVPVLAGSASYAVSETFHWHEGLKRSFKKAYGFYTVIIIAVLVGALINVIGINPISFLYYSAVLNGIIAPPLLIMIFLISNNKKIMGERVNATTTNILGIITIVLMSALALLLLASFTIWKS